MKHKTIAVVAVIMVIVFGGTILLYPTLFNSDAKKGTPIEAPPIPPQPTMGQ